MPIVDYPLATTIYSKPKDAYLYLQLDFSHNPKAIDEIQKGVALRIRRICSSEQDYFEKSKEYMT